MFCWQNILLFGSSIENRDEWDVKILVHYVEVGLTLSMITEHCNIQECI